MNGYSFNSKTAFVFSGGASLGAIEVGALKALVERGIRADLVLGTSVGSLNGAMFAYDPSEKQVEKIENIWRNIKVWDVFTPSPLTPVVNLTTAGEHLVSPKNLRKLIVENLPFERIEDTKLPLYIIGTDIKSGEEVVFNKGLVSEALMSSAGIPGVFPVQHMSERALVDGGLVNNSPISTAVRLGAERIIIFPIGVPSSNQKPGNVMEILIRSFIYLLNRQLTTDIQLYKEKVDLIIIPPPNPIDVGPHDFTKSDQLIDTAYERATKWLDEEGIFPNVDKYPLPCNVHTTEINFMEAVEPAPPKKATTRVKESIADKTEKLDDAISRTSKTIKEDLIKSRDEIREKLFKKKSKK
jgi:NTE family protein